MTNERLKYLVDEIANNNDQVAFDEFYNHFFPGLFSYSVSITKDQLTSEELIEDVFLRIWENRTVLPSLKSISHYLYVSVKNSCLKYLHSKAYRFNKNKIDFDIIDEGQLYSYVTPDNNIISNEIINQINTLLSKLPPKRLLIFRLIKEEGLKYREVAEILDVSIKTVETQMSFAFKQIYEIFESDLPEFKSYIQASRKK